MKRFIYFLIFAVAIAAAGCNGSATNEPTNAKSTVAVKGHTYRVSDGTNYISFYFASDFTCAMTANVNGEYTSNSSMTYKLDGNNIDVYRDNSTYWQAAYRGTLLYHMVYRPNDDTILFEGSVFTRYN